MRTSSHLLAAVRKREAMLLESVYSRSFCWKRASYLEGEQDVTEPGGGLSSLTEGSPQPQTGQLLGGPHMRSLPLSTSLLLLAHWSASDP